jgi:hypothetical protein
MIGEANAFGLIISVGVVRRGGALRQLVVRTGWPALFEATTWRLERELLVRMPRLTLFWLEREDRVAATAELLAWLREAYPAVLRAVVVHRLDGEVEVAIRSSGVQFYLPTRGDIRRLVEHVILPLARHEQPRAARVSASRPGVARGDGQVAPGRGTRFRRDWHPP